MGQLNKLMQSGDKDSLRLAFQILRAVGDLAEEANEDIESKELPFELVSNANNWKILFELVEAGCPY